MSPAAGAGLLPWALGFADGILNALTVAAAMPLPIAPGGKMPCCSIHSKDSSNVSLV